MQNDLICKNNSLNEQNPLDKEHDFIIGRIDDLACSDYEDNPNFIKLYSIFDSTARMHGQPMVSLNDDVIKRNLKLDICKDKESMYFINAKSFDLFKIGYMNVLNGAIVPNYHLVINFAELVNTDNYKL